MKIHIEDDEQLDVFKRIAYDSLALLLTREEIGYIVVHNTDGTCLKTGIDEDEVMWVSKYTEDDEEVQ